MTALFPTPVVYDGNERRYLQRDGARFAQAIESEGGRGIKIVLAGKTPTRPPSSPLLEVSEMEQWRNPAYWSAFQADYALCYFGFDSRRFLSVVRAMRQSGIRLALKMDSALGLGSFSKFFSIAFKKEYWWARHNHSPIKSFLKGLRSLGKYAIGKQAANILPYLDAFSLITAESPLAADNTRRWLVSHGREDLARKVVLLPHPVPDSFLPGDPSSKTNRIIAIAEDWNLPLKGGAVLAPAIERFLNRHGDWRATIVGSHSSRFGFLRERFGDRVSLFGWMPSKDILELYRESKILCIASATESGPIVAFEALACGCSLVFSKSIPQLEWVCDNKIGTMSHSRTANGLAIALETEWIAWSNAGAKRQDKIVTLLPPVHVSECLHDLECELGLRSHSRGGRNSGKNHENMWNSRRDNRENQPTTTITIF